MTIASGVGMLAGWSVESRSGARCCRAAAQPQRQSNRPARDVDLRRVNRHLRHRFLLTMALSRYRELAADRSGAILIGKPSVLASALSTSRATWAGFRAPTSQVRGQ